MRRAPVVMLLVATITLAGCRSILGLETPAIDDRVTDAAVVDAFVPDAQCSFHGVNLCALLPDQPLEITTPTTLSSAVGATGTCSRTISIEGRTACLVFASSILINSQLRFVGSNPVVLASAGDIYVQGAGILDVAGGGAGADLGCPISAPGEDAAVAGTLSGGGGAGGSFLTRGGDGGSAAGTMGGGSAPAVAVPTYPRGGCRGGNGGGGNGAPAVARAAGGLAGGAIWLIALATIKIDGIVIASGGGGAGGPAPGGGGPGGGGGGGGGGAGGFVLLTAKQITITGRVAAKGGGGGEGGSTVMGLPGEDGGSRRLAASGGASPSAGGDGGGSPVQGNALPGQSTLDTGMGGGGGGGGGAGLIVIDGPVIIGPSGLIVPSQQP